MPDDQVTANPPPGASPPGGSTPVRTLAVTSGKGGVGKTNVSVNLAVAMQSAGHNVLVMDADLGLANADVLLGVQPRFNLSHVMDGSMTLEEVVVTSTSGVRLVPAASGTQRMVSLTEAEHSGLIRAFSELSFPVDTLIIFLSLRDSGM